MARAGTTAKEINTMISKKIRVSLMWASMIFAIVASSGIASASQGWG